MHIKNISFRNFGSYGNRLMDLNLPDEPGFFLVQGKNGNGKSTLSDVIKFALYGKLENKKLKDMANRMNKHAEIKISLSTRKGTVVVERGVEPGYFRLFLNGKQIDKAGKRSVQEYLEEELLEMPFYVFSNTLSLSINDFKSFIRMSNFDKRAIIDKIFGLQVLNQMREVLKTQNKKLKEAVENLNSSVSAYTRSLETAHNELEKLQSKIQESQGEKLKDLEERLTKLEDFIKKATSREDKIESKKLEAEKLKKAVETSISGDSQLVREAKQKISLYENSKCPTCASDLTTDFHKDTLKQYQDSMDEAKKRIEEKYEKQDKIIKAVDDLREKLRESQRQITSAETQYEQVEREIKSLKKENVSDESSSLLRIVEEAKKNIRINKQEKAKTENKMSFFSLIEEILGEKGIKQLAIRSILPSLNTEIQRLVKTLGLEHRIVFDEEFNAKLSHFGVDVSADTLSTGESKKVDFAVLLAIIRLLKMKYPGVNILFLDEIFSSVDGDGIYQILKILRDTVKEYNMNIFVISHYPLSYTEFDYTLEIKKSNGFSSFTVEKVS